MDPSTFRSNLRLLSTTAALAAAVMILFLPGQHPDIAVPQAIGREHAIERARAVLTWIGVETNELSVRAVPERREDLLERAQTTFGRRETATMIREKIFPMTGAYGWRVVFSPVEGNTGGSVGRTVHLTLDGELWGMEPGDRPTESGDYSVNGSSGQRPPARPLPPGSGAIELDSVGVVQAGISYLSGTALGAVGWGVDSVASGPYPQSRLLLLRPIEGSADADRILALGDRVELVVRADGKPERLKMSPRENDGWEPETAWEIARLLLIVLLIVAMTISFLKRLGRRLVDGRSALFDGVVLGALAAVSILVSRELLLGADGQSFTWTSVLITLALSSVSATGITVFAYVIAACSESIAREVWSPKLQATFLVRRGRLLNRAVGTSVLTGVLFGISLLGWQILVMQLDPKTAFAAPTDFGSSTSLVPVLRSAANLAVSLYLTALVSLTLATWIKRRGHGTPVLVAVVGLGFGLFRLAPFSIEATIGATVVTLLIGVAAAVAVVKLDLLALWTGLFTAHLLTSSFEGWFVTPAGLFDDALVSVLLVAGLVVLGIAGLRSRRTGYEDGELVPEYVLALASEERIKREFEIARQVQQIFLPTELPDVRGLDATAVCEPTHEVGGDYFDIVPLEDGRVAVAIGDVSGKGFQAAFFMTLAKGILRTLVRQALAPADLLGRFNRVFYENVPRHTFISVTYGVMDPRDGRFSFARAGHQPVLVRAGASGTVSELKPTGLAVGLDSGPRFENAIEEVSLRLEPGDLLVLYTDGISEALSPDRREYGTDRLRTLLEDHGGDPCEDLVARILTDVRGFMGSAPQHDDLTIVAVRYLGP